MGVEHHKSGDIARHKEVPSQHSRKGKKKIELKDCRVWKKSTPFLKINQAYDYMYVNLYLLFPTLCKFSIIGLSILIVTNNALTKRSRL